MQLDFFPNGENLQIANWQIATDTLIVIIKAKSQKFLQGVDQSSAQPDDHPRHELSNPILLTPTGANGENLGGSNLVAGVAL